MSRRHKTVSSLQKQLKDDLVQSIYNEVDMVAKMVVKRHIQERVYDQYVPNADSQYAYQRTFELKNSVRIGNINIGTKYITFDIFMDTSYIKANITEGNNWNQHADVWESDVSEMIPYWIEYGTNNSLWDRAPADYMEQSHHELDMGKLVRAFASALRGKGWNVLSVG